MKSLVLLVFVLAFIRLTQPALTNIHLSRVGSAEEKVGDLTRMEELTRTTPKEVKWYSKSHWFFEKIMEKLMTVERNDFVRLYK